MQRTIDGLALEDGIIPLREGLHVEQDGKTQQTPTMSLGAWLADPVWRRAGSARPPTHQTAMLTFAVRPCVLSR